MLKKIIQTVVFMTLIGLPSLAQMGSGSAFGVSVDVSGNTIDGTVNSGPEVSPTPFVQLMDQTTSDTQSVTLANADLMEYEASSSSNVASVITSYDATLGAQSQMSSATINDADVLVGTLVVGNFITITATNITTAAEITGACGSAGDMDLVESGSSSVVGLTVSVLGVNLVNNLTTSSPTTINIASTALGLLGVTGSLSVNRVTVNDGGASGTGSVDAVGLELTVQADAGALGLGNTAGIQLIMASSSASRDCDSLSVELLSFSIDD